MDFDLVIRSADIIDGTGRARYPGDLGLNDGKIAAIAAPGSLTAVQVIEASGLAVAPGFIDSHSHSDWLFPQANHSEVLAPLLLQGITTVVGGQCGFSPAPILGSKDQVVDDISVMLRDASFPYRWRSFAEFLDAMEQDGLLLNAAFMVGHGVLRAQVLENPAGPPAPEELVELKRQVRQALKDGAFGLTAGLAYAPGVFAENDELLALLQVVKDEDAIFGVHGRAYTWVSPFYKPMFFGPPHNLRSVKELIGLARQAGVRLQLSHQIFVGRRTWRTYRSVLREIDRAVDQGLDVAFDAFPYTVGNSTIKVVFPDWFLKDFERKVDDPASLRRLKGDITRLRIALGIEFRHLLLMSVGRSDMEELEGLNFNEIARRLQMPEFEAYMHVARQSRGQANVLLGTYSGDDDREEPLQAVLSHPLCAFMTDTILTSRGAQNPASYGTFPRLLGHYSRDLGLFSLEEAVRRMTSYPASRIGLQDVGRIMEGCWADLVLFDPALIADNTSLSRPNIPPSGIKAVLISGQVVAQEGCVASNQRFGRVLRRTV